MAISEGEQQLLESFQGGLKTILGEEIQAGNVVVEVWFGTMSHLPEPHLFVFLEKPFLTPIVSDIKGIVYRVMDDPHYWKAEYYDTDKRQVLACRFLSES